MSLALRPDQIADLAYLIANPKTMLLHDPAVGKTPTVCVLMQYCWQDEGIGTAWVMPKSLLRKNREELLRWTVFTEKEICILDGTPEQIKTQLKSGAKVFLMGYRRFTLSWRDLPKYFRCLVGDEIHLNGWGGHKSQNTEALYAATKSQFTRYVPMTGTLISGRLDTAYPSIQVIEPRYYGDYWAFFNFHAIEDFDGNIAGWRNEWKLKEIFRRHGLRRTFASIYGEEAVIFHNERCYMGARHRAMYDKFKAQAYLELDKFLLDGTMPGVGFIRARQLQEHPNVFPDLTAPGEYVDILPRELPDKLERMLVHFSDFQRTGKPFVVYTPLVPQIKQLTSLALKMDLKVAAMHGGVSARDRGKLDTAFKAGELQGLICNPQVASVGFNWGASGEQEVGHFFFVACDFLDTTILQAYRRGIRGKRQTPLLVTVMEYHDSTDQRVFEIIRRKSREANKADSTRPVLCLGQQARSRPGGFDFSTCQPEQTL